MWYWLDTNTNSWIRAEDSDEIEEEYISYMNDKRTGSRVYHCFGNGWSTCIDFDTMTTFCSSIKCLGTHKRNGFSDDHLTFKLERR